MRKFAHGGDVYRDDIQMDFSVNTNFIGIAEEIKSEIYKNIDGCDQYPDPGCETLKNAIGTMDCICPQQILCGNGASELLLAIMHGVKPKKILIPTPSFLGYEWAAGAVEGELIFYPLKEEARFQVTSDLCNALSEEIDVLVLANPNNPVGNTILWKDLSVILEDCREKGIIVILDECFLGFTLEGVSPLQKRGLYSNEIILRAFTKMYAIPGLRLGYLICKNRNLLEKIERQLPEWNVSLLAQVAGIAACGCGEIPKETPRKTKEEREYLQMGLKNFAQRMKKRGNTFRQYPSDANFLFFQTDLPMYEVLKKRGILIRDCSNYRGLSKGYYRISVKSRQQNQYLLNCLDEIWSKNERD